MNFNSQICTTEEQSKRLLALGLKRRTADCILVENPFKPNNYVMFPIVDVDETLENEMNNEPIPAWSLHRLIEMMPKRIKNVKEDWDICGHDITFVITEELDVNYEEPFEDYPCYNKYFHEGNLYDKIASSIAWLIKEGHFNKEYLED
jgi:hypothetical protein